MPHQAPSGLSYVLTRPQSRQPSEFHAAPSAEMASPPTTKMRIGPECAVQPTGTKDDAMWSGSVLLTMIPPRGIFEVTRMTT